MLLSELFAPQDLLVPFAPPDKWEAIRALVEHLVETGHVPRERLGEVLEAVLSREKSMSTGMERGVAIPHAAVDELESLAVAMGVVTRPEGLSFESADGRPAHFVVLLVIPRAQKLLHIRTLADVARTLSREDVREELLASTDAEGAHGILARAER